LVRSPIRNTCVPSDTHHRNCACLPHTHTSGRWRSFSEPGQPPAKPHMSGNRCHLAPMRVLWRLTLWSFIDGKPGTTPGNVKLLLPPRQSRGISLCIRTRGQPVGRLALNAGHSPAVCRRGHLLVGSIWARADLFRALPSHRGARRAECVVRHGLIHPVSYME
jgi:hypothetical protein